MALQSVNPATGELIREYERMDERAVDAILAAVRSTWAEWQHSEMDLRCALLRRAAELLRERRADLARLMTTEMGKPLAGSLSEIEKCAWVCEHYAEHGPAALADQPIDADAARSYVSFRPLGPVLAVMPWNFPFWQVFRFAAPALLAGNTGVLKHASNVSGCALAIERLLRDAGFPGDAFRVILVPSEDVEAIVRDDRIAAVTLTGSESAGRAVARAAGDALKKTVLELGGSDPYVILEDADLPAAADACVKSRLINAGQSCIAAKRFIVPTAVRDEFSELVISRMRAAVVGDPLDDATDVGPMAREDLRDELHDQVVRALSQGATLELGGEIPDRAGAWYPPTVLSGVRPGNVAHDQELFGPVAVIVPARDEEDALRLANATSFGLGAAVFTADVERGERIARDVIEAGCCFVNSFVRSDPRLPFGGIKRSGYGRELGTFGIREFVNVKSILVAGPPSGQ